MKLGATLSSAPASRYHPIGVHGQPVFSNHVQLKAALLQRFGPSHAALFARPDQDPRDETIRWVSEVPGEVKSWTGLTEGEQALAALTLETYRSDLMAYAADIRRQSGDGGARSFAALLEQAVIIPSPEHLHFVGDQPVLSFWGFEVAKGQGIDGLGLKPPPPAPTAAPAAAAVPVAAPASRWRWLWALLPLLLLLLLLGAWLFWGYGCTEPAATGVEPQKQQEPKPEDKKPDPVKPDPAKPDERKPDEPKPLVPGERVTPLVPGVPVPGQTAPAPGVPLTPEARPVAPSVPPVPRPDGQAGQPPKPPQTDRGIVPPPPSGVRPPPQPPQQSPRQPLEIPPDAARGGGLGFLEGLWQSRRGLVDHVTGEELIQEYRLDGRGGGEVIVRRADGVECRGAVQGGFDGGKLVLREQGDIACPDGRSYSRSETQCERLASGLTYCRGVNPDGSGYRVGLDKAP